MQLDYTIRPYQPSDWTAITSIHDLARPDELAGSCDPRAFIPIEQDPEVEHLKSCRKFVALAGDRVVGFIGVDGDYIGWLYVHPEYYHQGLGRKLLRRGLREATGTPWTIALADNTPAVNLYQSEGFIVVRRYQSENAGYPCTCLRLEKQS